MELIARSVTLSVLAGICCKVFFETFARSRKWKNKWMEHLAVPVFALGFMAIAVTPIPPFLLQPVRLVAVIALGAQICFQIKGWKNLVLSLLFCCMYWIISVLCVSTLYAFPLFRSGSFSDMLEYVIGGLLLCLCIWIRFLFGKRMLIWAEGKKRISWLCIPLLCMAVIMAFCMMPWKEDIAENRARMVAAAGFVLMNLYVFYVMGTLLEKEEETHRLWMLQAQTENQMSMYRSMQKSYEKQRRFLHDYKNQLNCIQGMVERGEKQETLAYLASLTGSLAKSADYVNTNHKAVNVVLNQKYQEAWEKGITISMAINDLSGLTINEEEVVTLLANLLDNGIEACEKLKQHKVIQFKMMIEEEQLILSVRNPVEKPVFIKGKRIATSKKEGREHGIGLMNVDAVIRGNGGSSVLKCEDGWFSFSAMIPMSH